MRHKDRTAEEWRELAKKSRKQAEVFALIAVIFGVVSLLLFGLSLMFA